MWVPAQRYTISTHSPTFFNTLHNFRMPTTTTKRAPMTAESKAKMIATRAANKALKDAGQAVPNTKHKEKKTDAEKVANKAAGLAKRLATLAAKKANKDIKLDI